VTRGSGARGDRAWELPAVFSRSRCSSELHRTALAAVWSAWPVTFDELATPRAAAMGLDPGILGGGIESPSHRVHPGVGRDEVMLLRRGITSAFIVIPVGSPAARWIGLLNGVLVNYGRYQASSRRLS